LKSNRVFVSSIIDKDYNWIYHEALLFLKTFRRVYPRDKIFIYYPGKDIKIKLLLKKHKVNIIRNLNIENNYYAIKPTLCHYIANKYQIDYLTWTDIDSVFYKSNKPQIEILKHPKNDYTLKNNKLIYLTSKIFKTKEVKIHTSSAIFTLDKKTINKYFLNFKNLFKKLSKNKGIYNKIYKNISLDFLERTLEEFSFNLSILNIRKSYNNHLEYFGKKVRKNISCHDHYYIDRIQLKPKILQKDEYKLYRLKENIG